MNFRCFPLLLIAFIVSFGANSQINLKNKVAELGAHPSNDQLFVAKIIDKQTQKPEDIWEMSAKISSILPEKFEQLLKEEKIFPHGVHYKLDSDLNVKFQETYEYGKKEGEVKAFYRSGELKFQGYNSRGKYKKEAIYYYPNGTVKKKVVYPLNIHEKEVTEYFSNGNIKSKLAYQNFKIHGNATFYFENGKTKRKIKFKEGETISEKCYDKDGNKINCTPLFTDINFPGGEEALRAEIEKIKFEPETELNDTSVCKLILHINTEGSASLVVSYVNNKESHKAAISDWIKQLPKFNPTTYNEEKANTLLEIRFPYMNQHVVWLGESNENHPHNFSFNCDVLEDCFTSYLFYPLPASDEVYLAVEQMPEFPGGESGLRSYIASHIQYPIEAQKSGIQGKVYIKFIIDQNGNVKAPGVARSVHPLLDQEALRVIRTMPKWEPGISDGKRVCVSYMCPVNFAFR